MGREVRAVSVEDWPWIVTLNAANEVETSRLAEADMAKIARESWAMLACGKEAFLIAYDEASAYGSPNFLWFRTRYRDFVYVDRVVVAMHARGRGLAGALYEKLIAEARRAPGCSRIVCEVNFDPPNPASDAFHARMGFEEVGRARLANGKAVRYLCRDLGGG